MEWATKSMFYLFPMQLTERAGGHAVHTGVKADPEGKALLEAEALGIPLCVHTPGASLLVFSLILTSD